MYKLFTFFIMMFLLNTSLNAHQTKSILILHSYSQEYPWTKGQHNSFVKKIREKTGSEISFYSEYLDSKRVNFTDDYQEFYYEYLNKKYNKLHPLIVYATDDNALNFLIKYKDKLFSHSKAKVIFSGVNNLGLKKKLDPTKYLGVFEKKDIAKNIDLIQSFSPETKDIYFLSDYSNTSKVIKKDIENTMANYPELKPHFISGKYIEDLKKEVAELEESIIIFTTIGLIRDSNNTLLELEKIITTLTKDSTNIFIAMEDGYLFDGVLGGLVESSVKQGTLAADIALKVINQEKISNTISFIDDSSLYYFDAKQLLAHNIFLEDSILNEAMIINKEKSFWEKYEKILKFFLYTLILGVISLLLVLIHIYRHKNKVIEEKSKEQNILLSLFDKGDAVLFKWKNNPTWDVEYVSKNVKNLLGFEIDDFTSGDVAFGSLVNENDISRVVSEVGEAIENKYDFFKHQPYRLRTKEDSEKWILDYTVTQKNQDGDITHFIGYLIDITERKEHEQEMLKAKLEAERANQSKSMFLANMSHEIRTPMNAILGFVELLAKDEEDEKRQKQFNIIKNSGNTLLNIINDILDLSKIENGDMSLESNPNNIFYIFKETKLLFSDQVVKKNIQYKHHISSGVPKCMLVDIVRFKQVLFNLISNAIKFTPEGGEVKVDVDAKDGYLIVSVLDTGIGIAKENQSKIFKAFNQEDESTTRKFGGTGLGLSISSKIVSMMGGELKVDSKAGEGSKFYFEIPLKLCNEECNEAAKVRINQTVDSDVKKIDAYVLVVEDNQTNQLLIGMILDNFGVKYDIANDGVEAVDMFQKNRYDLIFMDENMPNMNGSESTKHIRDIESSNNLERTVIIALTANALKEDRKRFKDAGMDDYLSKPYTENDLFSLLVKYIK